MTKTTCLIAFGVSTLVCSTSVSAGAIGNMTYTWNGVGSGTLGGLTFENKSLRIEVIAYSDDIEEITNPTYLPGQQLLVSASSSDTAFNFYVEGQAVATAEQDLWMSLANGAGYFGVGFADKSVNDSDYVDMVNAFFSTDNPTNHYLSFEDTYREQSVDTIFAFPENESIATSAGAINISSFSGTFEAINAHSVPGAPGLFLLAGCIRPRRRRH